MSNPQLTKQIATWSIIILGLFGLMVLLAKLSTNGGTGSPSSDLLAPVSANDQTKGDTNAPNTIVEYSDFQCPFCAQFYPLLNQLAKEMPDKVKIIYRSFPLRSIHSNAQLAAQAAEAAGKQGKFWEMHDVLFNTQTSWSPLEKPSEKFTEYANSLGLDVNKFNADLNSQEVIDKVNNDYKSATKNGINGTPTLFLNGKLVELPAGYEELKNLIK